MNRKPKTKANQNRKKQHSYNIYEKYIKRSLDFICALIAILFLSPVMLVVAILVRIKLGSPIIFTQERPGRNEKIFKMYKFRSMSNARDKNGNLLPDEKRLGNFGKSLRATSLDELPELFNILKGEMSIVGPRPLLVEDMVFMTAKQRRRYKVRQGLTGLAQVMGRNNITWEQKILYDLAYIDKISLMGDIKIILKTVKKVVGRSDIVREGTISDVDFGDYLLQKNIISKEIYLKKQKIAKKLIKTYYANNYK